MRLVRVPDLQLAFQDVKEFVSGMHVWADFNVLLQGNEFRKVRIQLAVGNHISKTFEIVGGIVYPRLRQANTLLFAMNAEKRVRLSLKEVRKVFAEDHGYPGQVQQRGHDAPGLQLGKKPGR